MRSQSLLHHRWFLSIVVVFFGLLIKYFYSQANTDQLDWLLRPLVVLVSLVTGLQFEYECGLGWVNLDNAVAIAPSCAGVNFLVLSFCLSSYQFIWTPGSKASGLSLVFLFVGACIITLVTNALRIVLSVTALEQSLLLGMAGPEAAHRLSGVVIYYTVLIIYYEAVSSGIGGPRSVRGGSLFYLLIPLVWYLGYSLLLPAVNPANPGLSEKFWVHAQVVIMVSGTITLLLTAIFWVRQKTSGRMII